ncbi:MAG: TIGR04086 family membrane protein [Clostridiales bacterium]|nr:TIGR04086 family membrane protein [Clostridiales bacterium]
MFNIGKEENDFSNFNFINILKATGVAIVFTIILLFIYSIILTYTNTPEASIPTVIIIITGISILIASQMATRKLKKNGIINGGVVGLIYILGIYLISSIITGNFGFDLQSIIMCITSILVGCLGGIIGINMK